MHEHIKSTTPPMKSNLPEFVPVQKEGVFACLEVPGH
jgi:hypothetical protein